MSLRRRYVIRLVLLTLLACLSVSVVLLATGRARAADVAVDSAQDTARLVAAALGDRPQAVVDLIVLGDDDVLAVAVYDAGLRLTAAAAHPDAAIPTAADVRSLLDTVTPRQPQPYDVDGDVLTTIAASPSPATRHVIVAMDVSEANAIIWSLVRLALLVTAVAATATGLLAWFTARRLSDPISDLDAASRALESGDYEPAALSKVMARRDELGHMARRFDDMAQQVQARERALARQVADLQVRIDQAARQRRVDEITGSESFAALEVRAQRQRERRRLLEAAADHPAAAPGDDASRPGPRTA